MNNNNFETLTGNDDFKALTGTIAQTLIEKNHAYHNSYDDTVDTYGLTTIGVRLEDKYNRVKNLLLSGELSENDEALVDTLLDLSGYSILALRYLISRGKVSQKDIDKFNEKSKKFYDAVFQEMLVKQKQEEIQNNNLAPKQASSINK